MLVAIERRLPKIGAGAVVIGIIILAALAFILFSIISQRGSGKVNTAAGKQFPCTVLSVYDGDGPINCAETDAAGKPVTVRLRGIEAREADNSCQADVCPNATGAEAKAQLTRLAVGRLQCESFGPSYNRVDAACRTATGVDISCEMIRSGTATRWAQYDPEGRLAGCVPKPK
jgi:endonuclease YncB( thermonuclease family)